MSERYPQCGAMYARVGRLNLCRPRVTNPVTKTITQRTVNNNGNANTVTPRKRGRLRKPDALSPAEQSTGASVMRQDDGIRWVVVVASCSPARAPGCGGIRPASRPRGTWAL